MKGRIILVIGTIFLFAFLSGLLGYVTMGGPDLETAYHEGNVEITQKSSAGEVPHTIEVKNSGQRPVRVKTGTILRSETSGDLVTAEDAEVAPESSAEVLAYSLEPERRTMKGSDLEPAGTVPSLMQDVISSSNPENPQEAFRTQLMIWVLARGDDLNIYRGEVYATVKWRDMRFYQLRDNITAVKSEIASEYGLTEDQLNEVNINSSLLNRSQSPFKIFSMLEGLKNRFGAIP
ncbi:hypothetical protein [Methanothermobacter sp. EMTCatA1]|jgi:hypothetical protein|uniref:hypothetical protein n=1 Tax=Methanothermobacter TaxID=145260 RepID=UPI000B61C609|nr:hypothetical protein [Methanothermobacter sp. EMTCatA1]MBC7110805.1 hypothetical protein [Methanothermobacter sp.]MDN5373935.1 hypothetical protein [Methanothermobacter sp.]BAZ98658.1 hypothetical protein tca_00583 [Methanothermobacter sp. EMTCatA1]